MPIYKQNNFVLVVVCIGRLTYVEEAVPSAFAWKRSSPRKRPPPTPRASYPTGEQKARASLDLSAVYDPLSETSQDTNIDPDSSSEAWQNMNAIADRSSETVGLEVIASENLSDVLENRVFYEDLERQAAKMKQLLGESKAKTVQLEAEVKKVRSHASNLF